MALSSNVLQQLAAGNNRLDSLASALDAPKRAVVKAVQTLKARGLATTHSVVAGEVSGPAAGTYALTEAGRAWAASGKPIAPGQGERPRVRTVGLRERAWWHLRAHKIATLKELLTTHADGSEKAADINLYKYLVALERAGILRRAARRVPARQSRGLVQWVLVKDLGPKAPVWRQVAKVVFDPNDGGAIDISQESGGE